MSDSGRYYWIKLRTDFFNQPAHDFLMSQVNGAEYVVLYLMLCTQAANSNGLLVSEIGSITVPYDVDKIARDAKFFSRDTVCIALKLYKQLGLIEELGDGTLRIVGITDMVGSETASAQKVREWRSKKKSVELQNELQCKLQCNYNVTQENRDKENKSIDIIEKEINKEKNEELFLSVGLSVEEYRLLLSMCPEDRLREYMLSMQAWMNKSGRKYKKPFATLKSWIKRDINQTSESASYSVEAFEDFAKDFDLEKVKKVR